MERVTAARKLSKPPVKSLAIALEIFSELGTGPGELSVSGISSRLGRDKSQVSRVLATLRLAGFVQQNPVNRHYRVGLRAYTLGCRYLDSDQLAREAYPFLRTAADRTGYTSTLCIRDRMRGLYLIGIESSVFVDFGTNVGRYFSLHRTTPGKLLIAFSELSFQDAIVKAQWESKPVAQRAVTDRRAFRRELSSIAKRGYVISRGEMTPGIGAIAVPVFGNENSFVASFSIAFPLARVAEDKQPPLLSALHDLARMLSLRLGAKSYPFPYRRRPGASYKHAQNESGIELIG
jgi:IclR family KDG regulon transcriptional repressor